MSRGGRLRSGLAALVGLLVLAGVGAAEAQSPDEAAGPKPPNFIVIMTDDETVGDMAVMPRTRRLIGRAGVTFTRSYVSYPVCCPSRATYLTGQYTHNNDVRCLYRWCHGGYGSLKQEEYLPVWLRRADYVTSHIGKFLNGYGSEWPAEKPKGWSEWNGLIDHSTYRMWGYKIFEEDHAKTYGRPFRGDPRFYQTDVLRRKAVDFIRRRSRGADPYFLSVAFVAPHHESSHMQKHTGRLVRAAPRHRGHFAHLSYVPKPRSYNEQDVSDKPWFVGRWNKLLTPAREAAIAERMRERRESLLAVDEAVEAIVDVVRRSGELDNTYVLFTSDNGYMQGEHRVPMGKMLPYDPSTQVPLLIRGPGIPHGRQSPELVGNVDLTPTILDATPATSAKITMDGRSFLPFARNPGLTSARPLFHETGGVGAKGRGHREEGAPNVQVKVPAWRAVRTTRWLYVDYDGPTSELYDLNRDPAEMRSLSRDPTLRIRKNTLRRILFDLSRCAGRACQKLADASVR